MNKDSTNISQAIGYAGTVTVSIEDGDRVYRKKRFHNVGKTKLFEFFADCLTGNYSSAESSRPCRIVLFGGEDDMPNINNKLSSFVYYDAAPNIELEKNGEYSSVSYHFRLPYLALKVGRNVYACGLYPANNNSDMCAFFQFDKPLPLLSTDSNMTVIIDWKMTISNQDIEYKTKSDANASSSNNADSSSNTSDSNNISSDDSSGADHN